MPAVSGSAGVEKAGRALSNGFGLWGTVDSLNSIPGWTPAKHRALIDGWVDGCHSLGLTDIDAAALGDYKLGRWLVDNASGWSSYTPQMVQNEAIRTTRRLIRQHIRSEHQTVQSLKAELVLNYTDYYPVSYARRLERGHSSLRGE